MTPQDARADLAIIGHILAHNPDLERFLKMARQLRQGYQDGELSIPSDIDLTAMDTETAAAAAALILFARG